MASHGRVPTETSATSQGDDERFRGLYERFFGRVVSYFRGQGSPVDRARDLAQETFYRAYRGISLFRGEASDATWLFKIARNVWLNDRRVQRSEKRNAPTVSLDEETPPGDLFGWLESESGLLGEERSAGHLLVSTAKPALDEVVAQEQKQTLRAALQRLPTRMRQCASLRYGQGRTYAEIAAVMQISMDTVKSLLFQARARLIKELGSAAGGTSSN